MPSKPLLFCDIDGVLSVWPVALDGCPIADFLNVEGIPHAISRRAGAHLRDLAATYEVVWASGWEEKANEHLPAVLGCGPFPHLELDAARGAGVSVHGHWKLGSIDAWAGPDRPLAFVDDVLDEACHTWAAARPGPTLLVPTQPATGLDDEAAAALRAFAAAVA
ncbi:MAG TPA: hypothetical protein VD931_21940 [Baekduia sp.]|nr:hypothetical protein [Baekduia sp.]